MTGFGGKCSREEICSRPCLRAFCLAILGTIFIFAAVCCTGIWMHLTPLYTAIECHQQSAGLERLKMGVPLISPTEFDLQIEMNCSNPNPYSLSFEFTEPGKVFIGKSMTLVGETSQAVNKTSHFPAGSTGPFWVKASTRISAGMLVGVAADLLTSHGHMELRLQLRQRLMVDVTLILGAAMAIQQDFKKDCGMMIGNLGLHPSIGPMSCADHFEDLTILPTSGDSFDGVMRFAAKDIAPRVIKQGALAKNAGLGTSMAVFYLLGLVCYFFAGRKCWQVFGGSKARERRKVIESESSASSTESELEESNNVMWPVSQQMRERGQV